MSATTDKPQRTSNHVPHDILVRLREARKKKREYEAAGKPLPTGVKPWAKESMESLTKALSGK
jgi:hypothetical protein